jgi:hypothetical protein
MGELDLLTTCTRHSEIQVIAARLLISAAAKAFSSLLSSSSVSWKRLLTDEILQLPTLTSLLSGEHPATELQRHLLSASLSELN